MVAILLLDKLGRRFFLIAGTSCCIVALIGARASSSTSRASRRAPAGSALACLLFYIIGFAVGLGPVFWLMISEIFPLNVRGPAMAVCTVFNWAFNFVIAYTFLTPRRRDHEGGRLLALRLLRALRDRLLLDDGPGEQATAALEEIEQELGASPSARPRSRGRASRSATGAGRSPRAGSRTTATAPSRRC